MEKPLFIKNNSSELFTVYHEPNLSLETHTAQKIHCKDWGIIFCAPFGEEKLIAHRVLVKLARRFAEMGFSCLRFDHTGHGDSSGRFEDATVEIWKSDIEAIINYARLGLHIENIILLGVRFGATLAYLITHTNPTIKNLILISPIINGPDYIKLLLRSNLTTQMAAFKKIIKTREDLIKDLMNGQPVNVDGYLINKDLYLEMNHIDLLKGINSKAENILLIDLQKKNNHQSKIDLEKFRDILKNQHIDISTEEIVSDNFWTEWNTYQTEYKDMYNTITRWLLQLCENKK